MPSQQQKLSQVRKPRVHITYDVETGGAEQKKELPFVVGVIGDYAGNHSETEKTSLADRRFVQVEADTIDDIMASMKPGLKFKVKNTLSDDDSEIPIELQFRKMSDFEPEAIVDQVGVLSSLLELRNKLRDLLAKVDRSEELERILEKILTDKAALAEAISAIDTASP